MAQIPAKRHDIIITEIFADPSPRQQLPEVEFVEIFNKSTNPFDLASWKLFDGSTTSVLSNMLLLPGEYLVLAPAASASAFSAFGKVMGLSGFPSLNNSGDVIVLKNKEGQTIDSVHYTTAWYRDQDKNDGGWSLELIDPYNPCSGDVNWTASEDERGGTPAQQNSVFANKPDLTSPVLIAAFPVSADTIKLVFNEKLEDVTPSTENFTMSPDVMPVRAFFGNTGLTEIHVVVSPPMAPGVLYSAEARNIRDCNGNPMEGVARIEFGLPQIADSLDVVINEVLFNPRPGGVDFIEIVNASRKFINLKNWSIATMDEGMIKDSKPLTMQDLLIHPGSYQVLTENGAVLKGEYLSAHEETFVQTSLPALNDDEGTIVILDERGMVVDLFNYTDDMHAVFIKDEEGVSLERISFDQPTNESRNWKSASSQAGFATPGYLNSNATPGLSVIDGSIQVSPEIFVPVYGQPDFTQIRYQFDQGGFIANVRIYDTKGHLVKQVANNELLGTEGFFRWDGDKDDGTKARMGYYMVWVELFDAGGEVRTIRKRVALGTRH